MKSSLPPSWSIDQPVRASYLVFGRPDIHEKDIQSVVDTLRSGWIGTGPRVAEFEGAFGEYIGSSHALAVHSGSSGLHLSMVALDLKPGDEVIVPSMTFAATANAVIHAGATPVLVDVDPRTMCLDVAHMEASISTRTRAVIPVHFAGRFCAMEAIMRLAEAHNLFVIEDCAHAVETRFQGRHAGTFGNMGAFSFYVTKNVTTGEGGMICTDDPERAARIKILALHGLDADAWRRFSDEGFKQYEVLEPGFKYNMMDIQAALGIPQLERVEANLKRRCEIWEQYDDAFKDLPLDTPEEEERGTVHARHLYTVILDIDRLKSDRDTIQEALHRQNIGTGVHYRALHLHKYYRDEFRYKPEDLPHARWISDRTLSLPLSPQMTDEDVYDVVFSLRKTLQYYTH
ncbi:MAG: DegT/DnrJ/EryC1/StrS aminotransferase family protein [Candidatus Latescibacteria bacterium]|nr:DegT/DnrJ/EryC1/StrS aminotransferase family protein [Candidatus Latescibacterota bacterium]